MAVLTVRWLILTAAILAASYLLEGIEVRGFFSAFFTAAILGVLNVFFRPVLLILTLPLNLLSLGLFTFVINALMLMMASGVVSGFFVRDFFSALLGSLIISLVSAFLSCFVNERGTLEYIDLKKGRKGRWE